MAAIGRLQTFVNPTTMTKDIVYPLVLGPARAGLSKPHAKAQRREEE